jgi:putative MATE family efflux protein
MSTHSRQVDTTAGPLVGPLAVLAAPIVALQLLQVIYNLTDTFWVGRLGADAVSALSFSFPVVFVMLGVAGGFTAGGSILVAQHVGSKESARATLFAGQTLAATAAFSVVVAVLGYVLAPLCLRVVGTPVGTPIFDMALDYTRVMFVGNFGVFGFYVFQAVFRGWGDTRTPLYLMAFGVGLNLLVDPLFILGFDGNPLFAWLGLGDLGARLLALTGFRGLGVEGAAVATITARGIGTVVGLGLLFRGRSGLALDPDDLRPRREAVGRLVEVSTPLAVERTLTPIGIVAMTAIVALVGPAAVAGYGIGMRYVALVFLPALGLAQATEAAVGQNVGAGKPARARRATLLSVGLVAVIMGGVAAVVVAFTDPLVAVFVTGEGAAAVVGYGSDFLSVFALAFPFLGAFRIFVAAFGGAGHSRKALVVGLVEIAVLRVPIPLALLALGFGAASVWYGMTAAMVLGALFGGAWFLTGTWQTGGRDDLAGTPTPGDD